MIVLGLLLGHDRHRRQLRRAALHASTSRSSPTASASWRSRWACSASPRSSPTSSTSETREVFTGKVERPVADAGRTSRRVGAADPARHRARLVRSASCPAAARCSSSFARLHAGEEDRPSTPEQLRQGRHRRRGRARSGQQRRRADLVHPDAHARHPAQRGDGADGRRDDDPGHPARPAGDDRATRSCSGA